MNKIIILIALSAAAYYAYSNGYLGSVAGAETYSISNIQNKPIPQAELFGVWHATALEMCNDSIKSFNLSQRQCISKIDAQKASCQAIAGRNAAAVVATEQAAKQLGQAYLHCVVPGYHCDGTEVKTEEEARRYCQ